MQQLAGRSANDFEKTNTVAWLDQFFNPTGLKGAPKLNSDFAAFCRAHPKWKDAVKQGEDTEGVPNDVDDICAFNNIWRRKSKAGIEFLATQGNTIHFAIDASFDSKEAVKKPDGPIGVADDVFMPWGAKAETNGITPFKVALPGGGAVKYRVITYAELRFVFRNRMNPAIANNVQFWWQAATGTFFPGPPPWEHSSPHVAAWVSYERRRQAA